MFYDVPAMSNIVCTDPDQITGAYGSILDSEWMNEVTDNSMEGDCYLLLWLLQRLCVTVIIILTATVTDCYYYCYYYWWGFGSMPPSYPTTIGASGSANPLYNCWNWRNLFSKSMIERLNDRKGNCFLSSDWNNYWSEVLMFYMSHFYWLIRLLHTNLI